LFDLEQQVRNERRANLTNDPLAGDAIGRQIVRPGGKASMSEFKRVVLG
jgi:hypothetical protein